MQYIPNQKHIRNSKTNRCPCGNILKVYIWQKKKKRSLQKPDGWKVTQRGCLLSQSQKYFYSFVLLLFYGRQHPQPLETTAEGTRRGLQQMDVCSLKNVSPNISTTCFKGLQDDRIIKHIIRWIVNNNFSHFERIVSKTGLLFSVFWLFLATLMIFIDLWPHLHRTCTLHPEKSRLWPFTPEGCFSFCGKKY